ncbi:MAG TPA: molybdopterin molybdotransferase MoeA [Chitinophagaceae bacterium]|nr:molybdopterin molybdotransferase MoeA [Chitinophagaceae bacterium]
MPESHQLISLEEALQSILQQAQPPEEETLPLESSFGRVLAEQIIADRDYPPFNRATMDGYACSFEDIHLGQNTFMLAGTVMAGEPAGILPGKGTCVCIMTGAPVPEGADTLIKLEDTVLGKDQVVFSGAAVKRGQFIARQGEDARNGQLLLNEHCIIDPSLAALLASLGKANVRVCRLPAVALVSTGNEILPIKGKPSPYQIRDCNSWALKAFLMQYRISEVTSIRLPDDPVKLAAAIEPLLERDILILSGGVSKGQADHVPATLKSLGVQEIFHRVRIKPGQPLWFGKFPGGCLVFGLPGNPVSVQAAFKVFIEPFLRKSLGLTPVPEIFLPLGRGREKRTSFDEFFPVRLENDHSATLLFPVSYHSSGDFLSTTLSHGLALHPAEEKDLMEGQLLKYLSW